MIVLGLDLSTKTGFGLVNDQNQLLFYGICTEINSPEKSELCDEYHLLLRAQKITDSIMETAVEPHSPDFIFIEQTNLGSKRETQKFLEFIHCLILIKLEKKGLAHAVHYVDTSRWKSSLGIKMSKEDREHNKLVKTKKARGKITSKHLSVRWANEIYNLNFKLKDNDMADAIAVAAYGVKHLTSNSSRQTTEDQVNMALRLSPGN